MNDDDDDDDEIIRNQYENKMWKFIQIWNTKTKLIWKRNCENLYKYETQKHNWYENKMWKFIQKYETQKQKKTVQDLCEQIMWSQNENKLKTDFFSCLYSPQTICLADKSVIKWINYIFSANLTLTAGQFSYPLDK